MKDALPLSRHAIRHGTHMDRFWTRKGKLFYTRDKSRVAATMSQSGRRRGASIAKVPQCCLSVLVFLFLFSLVVCLDRGAQYLKLSCQMSSESDP